MHQALAALRRAGGDHAGAIREYQQVRTVLTTQLAVAATADLLYQLAMLDNNLLQAHYLTADHAAAVAALFVMSPGLLHVLYLSEMHMTWMAVGVLPWLLAANVAVIRRGTGVDYVRLGASLALLWMCHPPVALLTTYVCLVLQAANLAFLAPVALPWRELLMAATTFSAGFATSIRMSGDYGEALQGLLLVSWSIRQPKIFRCRARWHRILSTRASRASRSLT